MSRFAVLQSKMAEETQQAPSAVARLFQHERRELDDIGRRLRSTNPSVIITCARGSSDHAAAFFKYAVEIMLGVPVASMGPSVASLYGTKLRFNNAVMISVSQSGKSPDIVALHTTAREAGALTIAVVNGENSPLAAVSDIVVRLHCGPELSVAATKSLISSCAALVAIVAAWSGDMALKRAVDNLPASLDLALLQDWSAAEAIANANSGYTIGRGPSFPLAAEAALKLKEVASLHMEAFSAAEVMHGPLQLVTPGFPVIAFVQDDVAAPTSKAAVQRLIEAGADVFTASPLAMPGTVLPMLTTGHGITDPIAMILSFYGLAERISRLRGFNPDQPSQLHKVTETI
jgi:glutamine---fructose-6-phosphate transaminase (isomerizing)